MKAKDSSPKVIETCPECSVELDEEGRGEVCCGYVGDRCPACGGATCDQSC